MRSKIGLLVCLVFVGLLPKTVLAELTNEDLLNATEEFYEFSKNPVGYQINHLPGAEQAKKITKDFLNDQLSRIHDPNMSVDADRLAEADKYSVVFSDLYQDAQAAGGATGLADSTSAIIDELEKEAKEQKKKLETQKNRTQKFKDAMGGDDLLSEGEKEMSEEFIELVLENADDIRSKLKQIAARAAQLKGSPLLPPFDPDFIKNHIKHEKGLSTSVVLPADMVAAVWQGRASEYFTMAQATYSVEDFEKGQTVLDTSLFQLSSGAHGFVFHVALDAKTPSSFGGSFTPSGCIQDADYIDAQGDHLGAIGKVGECILDVTPAKLLGAAKKGQRLEKAVDDAMKEYLKKRYKKDKDKVKNKIKEEAKKDFLGRLDPDDENQGEMGGKHTADAIKNPKKYSREVNQNRIEDITDGALEDGYDEKTRAQIDDDCELVGGVQGRSACENRKRKADARAEKEKDDWYD